MSATPLDLALGQVEAQRDVLARLRQTTAKAERAMGGRLPEARRQGASDFELSKACGLGVVHVRMLIRLVDPEYTPRTSRAG
jgi:hypothetical protein